METLPDIEAEMYRLVEAAQEEGILLRLIGGLAIKIHSSSAQHRSLEREYPDIDFVTNKASRNRIQKFLPEMGYEPNKTLNTLSGDRRQLYYDRPRGRQIDVFIGEFEMCHKLPLSDRLHVEPVTIPLAELFLTKAQIVELNRKDILDLLALVLDHEIGDTDDDTINKSIIADLCAEDWGLHTTTLMTLDKVLDFLHADEVELDESQRTLVEQRLAEIRKAIEAAPKTLAWKMRDKIGTRVRWYEEVEEVRR